MSLDTSNTNQVIEVSLGWVDVISIFSSAASLIMAVLAIWLSITFYKMSNASAKEMNGSTEKINSTVAKLEKMFETMYNDTFSMVKDTVTHMRNQVDKNSRLDTSFEIKNKVDELISEQLRNIAPENLSKEEMKGIILEILKETKEIELDIKKKIMKDSVINILIQEGEKTFNYLQDKILGNNYNSNEFKTFFDLIYEMTKEGILNAEFSEDPFDGLAVTSSKPIKLLRVS